MVFIKIKSSEHRAQERKVLRSFSCSSTSKEAREYAECVAARTREVMESMGRETR